MPYKKIIKSTSLFGGVQLLNLIFSFLKTKFITQFLGPNGYGLFTILGNSIEIVRSIIGFSIETAGVKNISAENKNPEKLSFHYSLLIKIAILSGVLGILITLLLAPWLSYLVFDTTQKWFSFIFLSSIIFFKQLSNGNSAILQGVERFTDLAKTTVLSSLFSLVVTLPLLYFYRFDGIVPSLVLSAFLSYSISTIYRSKLKIKRIELPLRVAIQKSKEVLIFGGLLTLSGYLPMLMNYMVQLHINKTEGLAQVGIFGVALVLMNGYVDMIFNAMSTEYYPRLTATINDKTKTTETVNHQIQFSMLMMVPILLFFIGFSPFIIQILFNKEFLGVIPLLNWALVGMFFKAISFCMGYVIIAKADKKLFTYTTLIFNFLYIVLLVTGYYFYGLEGVGIAFFIYYLLHFLSIYFLTKKYYHLKVSTQEFKILGISLLFFITLFMLMQVKFLWLKYLLLTILVLINITYSFLKLYRNYKNTL